jgi:hypothetical protein
MGFEPTTFGLGSQHSTTELRPQKYLPLTAFYSNYISIVKSFSTVYMLSPALTIATTSSYRFNTPLFFWLKPELIRTIVMQLERKPGTISYI